MKIALAQLNYHIGNFEQNKNKIISTLNQMKQQGADIVVFAELAICGYPPRDFLEFNDFIKRCEEAVQEIALHCVGIAAIVGAPSKNPSSKGKPLFNAAWFLAHGKVQQIINKTLLPNYDIFDEYRYFEPNRDFQIVAYKGQRIALTVCEDIWNTGKQSLYVTNPMDELIKQHPDMMINIAASPFSFKQALRRKEILTHNAKKYQIPLFYVNHVGAQTELIFDGGSLAINAQGVIAQEMPYFKEATVLFDSEAVQKATHPVENSTEKISLIHQALILGISDYFNKLGFKKAILGLSGGIDSALTLALAAEALGPQNCRAVLLPSRFSSDHSIKDAVDLAENLGVPYDTIAINPTVEALEETMAPYFAGLPFGLAEENMQARIRGVILMAQSNKLGYILLNTSNKSEAAVGYGTLYGDMCGGLSVLGDLYKTEVFELSRYINREKEIIPVNSIVKPPSAELRPDQKDSDSLPDYDILDQILYAYIEERKGPAGIIARGFNPALVNRVLRMVNLNEWKRAQTSPVLRISDKAFGQGRRMPIVGKYLI